MNFCAAVKIDFQSTWHMLSQSGKKEPQFKYCVLADRQICGYFFLIDDWQDCACNTVGSTTSG